MHKDEPLTVVIWTDSDGTYMLDGRKPKKISEAVDQYYVSSYSTCVEAAKLETCKSWIDRETNEYHLCFDYSATQAAVELVYNYLLDTWYPPWTRQVGAVTSYITSALSFKPAGRRNYVCVGTSIGIIFQLETDTTDKSEANADVVITNSIRTRAISFSPDKLGASYWFVLRSILLEAKTETVATTKTITTKIYRDGISTGVTIATPGTISLEKSGYTCIVDGLDINYTRLSLFEIEFISATADLLLEIYSLVCMIEVEGDRTIV
jgi:hypothetical protein